MSTAQGTGKAKKYKPSDSREARRERKRRNRAPARERAEKEALDLIIADLRNDPGPALALHIWREEAPRLVDAVTGEESPLMRHVRGLVLERGVLTLTLEDVPVAIDWAEEDGA